MKFQKDNSANRLTAEIVAQQRAEAEARRQKKREDAVRTRAERAAAAEIAAAAAAAAKPLKDRIGAYPLVTDQLDMLWHDIDEGRLAANTTFANTWYQTIKTVKLNNPLP